MSEAQKKVALITGANKGIGFEVARQLGTAGHTILVGARQPALGQQAAATLQSAQIDARAIELDLDRPETIASAAATIRADFGHLDILVNNAGIVSPGDGPPSTTSLEAIERTMRVNFLGAVALTQAMLPLLREAAAARIVNVSSGLGSITLNGDLTSPYADVKVLAYSASKAALNMFTVQLAYELRNTPIKVNAADPGYTATDMNGHRGHQTVEQGSVAIVHLAQLPESGPSGGFFDAAGSEPW